MVRRRKKEKWYTHETHTGWEKDLSTERRRELALEGHGGDYLATARGLQALANVTQDAETKRKAKSDADYFFRQYKRYE